MTSLAGPRDIIVSRTYGVGVDVVWAAWADADAFAGWYGPYGSSIRDCVLDVRRGGRMRFWHLVPGLPDQWVDGEYEDVVEGELVQVVLYPEDAEPGTDLARVRVIVRFVQEEAGTRVSIRHAGLRGHEDESRWWEESLDRLGSFLETQVPGRP